MEEPKMTSITTIPAEITQVVRSAVLTELGGAAADIEDASIGYEKEEHPERFQEPLERFDGLRALLNAIGWANVTVPIDLEEYGERLAHVLKERLELDRDFLGDFGEQETAKREAVERDIAGMERFLAENGLTEDE